MVVDESGGSHGLRDLGLLESAVARPQSSLIHGLLRNHPFVDRNKRTSIFSAMTFLELNGYKFDARQKEVVSFALKVENEKLSVEEIAKWLKEHTKRLKY